MFKNIAVAILLMYSSEMTVEARLNDWVAKTFGKINDD